MSNDNTLTEVNESASQFTIDIREAEALAKTFDFQGRDLELHIDMGFLVPTPMNFVILDPILFGVSAFIEVVDVATSSEGEEFITVDGFEEQIFDKVLTPEANKFVNDQIVSDTLAPSNFSYEGLGVFSFPVRIADKIRITLLMRDPIPSLYERLHVLTQEVLNNTSITTKKKKGL